MTHKVPLTPLEPWIIQKIDATAPNPGARPNLTREKIEAYQLKKLQETLNYAMSKSRFYQHHLAQAPKEITKLEDLVHLPFTTAKDIKDHALEFLCVSQGMISRVVTLNTSGTTGQPKRLYFTPEDQELTVDFFHIGMSTLTRPGDRVLILLPGKRSGSVGDLLRIALQRLGATPIPYGPVQDADHTLSIMQQEQVTSLVGVPTQVLALARNTTTPLRLKSVLLTTDHVPDAIVNVVEQAWGCRVFNHYGMTEMGLGGGVECAARRGYHLREADLYVEVIDAKSGQPVPDGEPGEVVFTTLTRTGMPLIRYRTGDISRFIPDQCPCGTALKTLTRIKNRANGYIPLKTGQVISLADLDESLFPIAGLLNFTAEIQHHPDKDRLHIQIQMQNTATGNNTAIQNALDSIRPLQQAGKARYLETVIEFTSQLDLPIMGKRVLKQSGID